jgi:hypothetical protein
LSSAIRFGVEPFAGIAYSQVRKSLCTVELYSLTPLSSRFELASVLMVPQPRRKVGFSGWNARPMPVLARSSRVLWYVFQLA